MHVSGSLLKEKHKGWGRRACHTGGSYSTVHFSNICGGCACVYSYTILMAFTVCV